MLLLPRYHARGVKSCIRVMTILHYTIALFVFLRSRKFLLLYNNNGLLLKWPCQMVLFNLDSSIAKLILGGNSKTDFTLFAMYKIVLVARSPVSSTAHSLATMMRSSCVKLSIVMTETHVKL